MEILDYNEIQLMLEQAITEYNEILKEVGCKHTFKSTDLDKHYAVYMAKTKMGKVGEPKDLPGKFT